MMAWLLFILVLFAPKIACALEMPASVVVQIKDTLSRQHLCSGVVIGSRQVLTARHCFPIENPERFFVVQSQANTPIAIRQLFFLTNESRLFPNRDIAILTLAEDLKLPASIDFEQFRRLNKGENLTVFARGFAEVSLDPKNVGRLKTASGRLIREYDGFRVEKVALFKSDKTALCVGDSGGPVFFRRGQRWFLYGIVNGLWDPITHTEANCSHETVITPLYHYANWIKAPRTPPQTLINAERFDSLEQACARRNHESSQFIAVQKVLLLLADSLDLTARTEILMRCVNSQKHWDNFVRTGKKFSLDAHVHLKGLTFLHSLKSLEISDISQENIGQLQDFQKLETLSLNGSAKMIDMGHLEIKTLRKIEIKNMRNLRGLKDFIHQHPLLEEINLIDLDSPASPLKMSWFSGLRHLKKLKIGMSAIEKDVILPRDVHLRLW